MLNRITADEAQALLESINAAMASATAAATCPASNFDTLDVVPINHGVQYIGNSSIGDNQMQMTLVTDGINCE
uniref:Uncharacterized protein n=1 Tax=Oryza rufipogon TaxID=4529 RepID=A0A0E0QHW2_ORYRU